MRKAIVFSFSFYIAVSFLHSADWYVRPKGGDYGVENGTSYANAWDGLKNVKWGSGGVQPGDTLWVCGYHLWSWNPGGNPYDGDIDVISGPSNAARVIIRGDYPGDPGIVWGAHVINYASWGYEGNNTWSIILDPDQPSNWFFEDVTSSSWKVLERKTTLQDCKNTPGSYYSPSYGHGSKLYVHCSDNGNPMNRITANCFGYRFLLGNKIYITFKNMSVYNAYAMHTYPPPVSHIRWENCKLWYGDAEIFNLTRGCTYWEIINCDIGWARTGINVNDNPGDGGESPHHYTVSGCAIHDIGVHDLDTDSHGMGIQGSHYGLIEGNEIYNIGTGITFYIFDSQSSTNHTVRWNYIHDFHTLGRLEPSRGIEFNTVGSDLDLSGNQIYGNIVVGAVDTAYRFRYKDLGKFYNNVAYNCGTSFYFSRQSGTTYSLKIELKNNISINPTLYHVYFQDPNHAAGTGDTNCRIISDYNIFYPLSGEQFFFQDSSGYRYYNFAGWKALSRPGCTFDPQSRAQDPQFINLSGSFSRDSDFQLQSSSPAIDAGVNVGISQDRLGTPIPQGFAPDIGVYEYIFGSNPLLVSAIASPTSGTAPLSVNFTGSASGGSPPYSYNWTYGDGQSSSSQNPSYTYFSAGDYMATLTVTDSQGTNSDKSVSINVTSPLPPLQLTASASALPTSGQPPLLVNFIGSASGGLAPYSYLWNFGDGSSSTVQNPTHTYSVMGIYAATLTVTDKNAASASATVIITVSTISAFNLSITSETGAPAPGEGGTTNPSPGNHSYAVGGTAEVRSIPNPDYRFSRWAVDIVDTSLFNQQALITMDRNKSLTATFCTICGDVNGDLKITPSDAQAAFDIFLGKIANPTWCEKENADVNSSGAKLDPKVTPADAQAIFHKYLKKGVLPSDCSGNSRSSTTALALGQQIANVTLILSSFTASAGEDIYMPILVDSPLEITAFGFDLEFPADRLAFVSIEKTALTDNYTQVDANVIITEYEEEKAEGKYNFSTLRVGGYKTVLIPGAKSGVLVTLVFRAKSNLAQDASLLITGTYDDIKSASINNSPIRLRNRQNQKERLSKRFGEKKLDF
jgi:PKD repeat protein